VGEQLGERKGNRAGFVLMVMDTLRDGRRLVRVVVMPALTGLRLLRWSSDAPLLMLSLPVDIIDMKL
jgi:hypothetical protein